MSYILVESHISGTTRTINAMASFCFSSIKSDTFYDGWFFMMDLRVYKGEYSNVAVYFWNVSNHFPKVREFSFWILDFLDDEMDLRVSEGKYKCCCLLLKLLGLFPASKGIVLFFGWWGGFETTIGAVEFEKSAAGQEFNHRDFIFIFIFLYFFGPIIYCLEQWNCTLANQDTKLGVHGLRGVFYGRRQTLSRDVLPSKSFHCTSNHDLTPCVNYMQVVKFIVCNLLS